ncbi:MAG: PqqD family protein [Actinomycetota bacterium]
MTNQDDAVLRLRSNELTWREVDGEIIALDLTSSLYFTANRTGTLLWSSLVDGARLGELTSLLIENFEIADADARRDVSNFIVLLDSHSLLERH